MNTFPIIGAFRYGLSTYRKHFFMLLAASAVVMSPMFLNVYFSHLQKEQAQKFSQKTSIDNVTQDTQAQDQQVLEVKPVTPKPSLSVALFLVFLLFVFMLLNIGFMRLGFHLYDTKTVVFEKLITSFGIILKIWAIVFFFIITFFIVSSIISSFFMSFNILQDPVGMSHLIYLIFGIVIFTTFLISPFLSVLFWYFVDNGGSFFEGLLKSFKLARRYYFYLMLFLIVNLLVCAIPSLLVNFFMAGFLTLFKPTLVSQLISYICTLFIMPFSTMTMVHVYRSLKA